MSAELIRLDGYVPVRIAGVVGLCQELGLDRLAVDLPAGLELQGELGIELLLSDRLTVQARRDRGSPRGPSPGTSWTCWPTSMTGAPA